MILGAGSKKSGLGESIRAGTVVKLADGRHPTLGWVIFWRQMAPRTPRCVWKTDNTGRRQSVKDLRPDAFLGPAYEAMPLMPRRSSARGLLRARTAVLAGEGTSGVLPSGVRSPLQSRNCSVRDDQGRR